MTKINTDLETDLIEGRIDALLTPSLQEDTKPDGEKMLRPVIANAQAAEEEYVRDYSVYPFNHVIVVRADVFGRSSDVSRGTVRSLRGSQSGDIQTSAGCDDGAASSAALEKVFDQFGGDLLPYGLIDLNRSVVQRPAGFLYDQKLIAAQPDINALFVEEGRG